MRAKEVGESKCCSVMVQIEVNLIPKGSRLPTGALLQESYNKAFQLGTANESRLISRCAPNA